jgi:hypothetical protein
VNSRRTDGDARIPREPGIRLDFEFDREDAMLELAVALASSGFRVNGSALGIIVLIVLAGVSFWFVRRRSSRADRDEREPPRDRDDR